MRMADDRSGEGLNHNLFTVGSYIKCRFQGDDVEGHVAAFNPTDRILVIRSPSSCGKSSNFDYVMINADCVEKISVEELIIPETVKPVDFQKLEKRRSKGAQTKRSKIRAMSAGVSKDARMLFLSIVKVIDDVVWEGEKIVVLNEVRISPPYKVENVQGDKEASFSHVKKMVDKYWKEQGSAGAGGGGSGTSTGGGGGGSSNNNNNSNSNNNTSSNSTSA